MDIDVSVVISPTNLRRLIEAAKELRLTPMLPVPLETLCDIDTLKQWHTHRNPQAFSLRSEAVLTVREDGAGGQGTANRRRAHQPVKS